MALQTEIIDKMSDLITVAFGLVAALAWNGAIQAIFTEIFGEQSDIPALLGYAILVTIIAVIATIMIGRAAARAREAQMAKERKV
ncbi:hypothetical protein ABH15_07060 [Methanoculleus taiwanensis]|uniref:Uncharacterized protein n=1 Tax=Methanoculleus taiwanensis TaxID=1550565 RepID=A0A498H017_9EURY|nr:DUF5654 family protein [Methanoculleus taiwanensis]RXE55958.1 hypothetical protein ABH15_07060 [Methanoculleus taiwanensis]